MALRDHQPQTLEEFNGLWKRGDQDSVPRDHFSDCNNIQFIESGFETRSGLDTLIAKSNVVRVYNYKLQTGESLLLLNTSGQIFHALLDGSNTVFGPILTIATMTDFGFFNFAGRAYITPFFTDVDNNGVNFQRGLQNNFVYVYKGDGTNARKAAGFPPSNSDDPPFIAYNINLVGGITQGIHVLGVAFSDGIDRSSALGTTVKPLLYAPGNQQAQVAHLPIGGVGITIREIYMTKTIDPADYNPLSLPTFYFVTSVNDNTTTDKIINVQDSDLVIPFAAGALANPTSGGITAEMSTNAGFCDLGLHVIGVCYETDTGYLTAPGPETLAVQTFVDGTKKILVKNIPISPDTFVVARHLVASKAISLYNGDDRGFQLFFIPDGVINDNTTTTLEVSFFDADLLDDASHLIDNFSEIPAGVTLSSYHGRMGLSGIYTDISLQYFSAEGEPEAIDQVDGVIIIPLDGMPLTNGQEYRDIYYAFKKTRTWAVIDNNDVPSSWAPYVIDNGVGSSVHGIATVLDSGGVNIDFLLITDFSGIMVFNGAYQRPELSWKIQDFWFALDRNNFGLLQFLNDSLSQILFVALPDGTMLIGDYKNGFNEKDIRWTPWSFDVLATTIALIQTNTLAIGSRDSV